MSERKPGQLDYEVADLIGAAITSHIRESTKFDLRTRLEIVTCKKCGCTCTKQLSSGRCMNCKEKL
jgi:hypothetical protein